ncbi:hypothetical protein [Brevundimonas guildfordensis]|uniref:Uncharacterized protein n=1 Tax=Brevundimonas guildfordensis TaxID=2762241 RepID=A0ABR8R1R9_9CAUL|nr:hypothetical protein [Brevundimonas guildfordensis]MBD7941725.1 hypothetical protein [Brevundimonas guildfordensis]
MIVENFIRLYAHDFSQMAGRAEMGQDVDDALARRLRDADTHAQVMDQRKGKGHLTALVARIREEASVFNGRVMRNGADPAEAAARRQAFLSEVADTLEKLRAARTSEGQQALA